MKQPPPKVVQPIEPDLTPDDVQDLFNEAYEPPEETEAEAELGDTAALTDHSVEEGLRKTREKELGINIPNQPESLTAPILNPAMMVEEAGAQARAEAAFQDKIDETTVIVTDEERDMFLRAALHDKEVLFDVKLDGLDMTVVVAMPSEAFTACAQTITKAWHNSGHIDLDSGTLQFFVAFQQIHLWWMVREINGEPVSWQWDEENNGKPTIQNIRKFASKYENLSDVINMHSLRYRLLMRASMIAEVKYKLCLQALHDRSFFTGAVTA